MRTLKEKLGLRIKYFRKKHGLSQEQLSEKTGLDIPNLSNIERGKRFMTAETLEKIACSLNTTERELFDFRDINPNLYLKDDINELLVSFSNEELEFVLSFLKNFVEFKNK